MDVSFQATLRPTRNPRCATQGSAMAVPNMRRMNSVLDWLNSRLEEARSQQLKSRLHYCGNNVTIYAPVVFAGPEALDVGDNTSIAPFVHIWCGGRVVIGANCMIGSHVEISS